MELLEAIKEKARVKAKTIVLPEAEDPRILKAAREIIDGKLANLILLGSKENLAGLSAQEGLDLPRPSHGGQACAQERGKLINPQESGLFEEFVDIYARLRKDKGISIVQSRQAVENPVYFAALMVRQGLADGFVAGAVHTSSDVIRAALHCVGVKKESSIASSYFLMLLPDKSIGEDGALLFADCGMVVEPDSRQLAEIAILSGGTFKSLVGAAPRIALLSYSTKGSGKGRAVDKVVEATRLAREKRPEWLIDGELQVDAAIIPDVAAKKTALEPLKGKANVLIFPSLEAGNIGYKLVQRLTEVKAVGPLLQGFNRPCSDLSRGCSTADIVNAAAITAAQG